MSHYNSCRLMAIVYKIYRSCLISIICSKMRAVNLVELMKSIKILEDKTVEYHKNYITNTKTLTDFSKSLNY